MIVQKLSKGESERPDYELEPIFMLDNAMYIPHYVDEHKWVSYGGETKTTVELLALDAELDFEHLWMRGWTERKIFRKRKRPCSVNQLKAMLLETK
jgi:hypothetical protein